MGRSPFLMILVFLVICTSALALTPDERTYFDSQNQKTIAQIDAKIDSEVLKANKYFRDEAEDVKAEVIVELESRLKGVLKSLAIGLGGVIILSLAVFKVIDLRLNATKSIQRYEDQLKSLVADNQKMHDTLKKDTESLAAARQQLIDYQQNLEHIERQLRATGQQIPMLAKPVMESKVPVEVKPKEKVLPKWKKAVLLLLILIFLICLCYIVFKAYVWSSIYFGGNES